MWGYLVVATLFCCSTLVSQSILLEDFSYPQGDSLVSHGWNAHASAGTNPVKVLSPGLMYTGYPGSEIGNAVRLAGTGEDVSRPMSGVSGTDLYVSFLVNVLDATTGSSEHFLHLNIGTHVGRVYVKESGGSIAFGAAKASEGAVFTGFDYDLNFTYLIVLRYTHADGDDNDGVRLYVFDSGVPAVEPESATIGPLTSAGSEPSEITAIALRQGGSTVTELILDGLRVGTNWEDAGLPVTMSSFGAAVSGREVLVKWRTESEVGNYGFEIERRVVYGSEFMVQGHGAMNHEPETWNRVGFVRGVGTSSSPRDYSYVDKPGQPGRYAYRIKQIDHSGSSIYTSTLEVDIGLAPLEFTLSQNYPNPFNPTTTIEFTIPEDGHVSLRVYDITGREVATLVDQHLTAGVYHRTVFDASRLASGLYFARLHAGGRHMIRKIMLVK